MMRGFTTMPFVLTLALTWLGLAPTVLQPSPAAAQPTAAALEVMTFNIRYGTANDGENRWELRREQLFELVKSEQPDVIGLQEALHGQIDEILAAAPGYAMIGVARSDGGQAGEYAAILYKRARLTVVTGGTFWLSDTPAVVASKTWGNNIERICTWARFDDKEGRPFYVYNVHLDHQSQPSRERAVDLLLKTIDTRNPRAPVIVTGDFNAGETNAATVAMARTFRDTFRVLHPQADEAGTFTGFKPGQTRGEKIDYVFVEPDAEVTRAEILRASRDGRCPSDHFPVVATIRLRP
jgi:endonuclease/exonuclease/phosphatase family metal-dependent hydrolase